MKFGLARYILGDVGFVEISKDNYEKLLTAKSCLIEAMCIEEKYDMALHNYFEFESTLASVAMEKGFRMHYDSESMLNIKSLLNRRVVNYLSSCRMYIDQIEAQLSLLSNEFGLSEGQIHGYFNCVFDRYLGYRVMDGVRNFSQHFDLPIEKIGVDVSFKGEALPVYVKLSSSVEYYASSDRVRKKTIEELRAIGSDVDIHKMMRESIGGLSDVHLQIRLALNSAIAVHDKTMAEAIDMYKNAHPELGDDAISGLCAVIVDDNMHIVEHKFIQEDWTLRRRQFEITNRFIQNMHLRYVKTNIK